MYIEHVYSDVPNARFLNANAGSKLGPIDHHMSAEPKAYEP